MELLPYIFVKFKLQVKNLFSSKIKAFQSDGGGEYTERAFQNLLTNNDINFRSSCPVTPNKMVWLNENITIFLT